MKLRKTIWGKNYIYWKAKHVTCEISRPSPPSWEFCIHNASQSLWAHHLYSCELRKFANVMFKSLQFISLVLQCLFSHRVATYFWLSLERIYVRPGHRRAILNKVVFLSYFEKIAHMSVVWAYVSLWLCMLGCLLQEPIRLNVLLVDA